MKNLTSKLMAYISQSKPSNNKLLLDEGIILFGLLLLLWISGNHWMQIYYPLSGSLDQNIWLLIILSLICFLTVTGLCWWLLQRFWLTLGLPEFTIIISQFKSLELWQQLGFFLFCFALLLFTAVGSLVAIC
jgi:hypothetical protein